MDARYLEELSWRFSEVYEAVVDRILINLARHFKYLKPNEITGSWEYQVKMLSQMGQVNKETEQIILSSLGDADGALKNLLEESIINGLKDAEPELRKAAEKGLLNGGVSSIHPSQMQAFTAYYNQSADKLNLVNTVMLESTEWAYQSTVADIVTRMNTTQGILNVATGEVVTGVSTYNQAIKDAVQKMVENGITGYIDHGGHKWSPEAYVAMDVRSTMANTARAAVFERCEQYGDDLYQVSWHNAARPLCFDWQCKVISRTDTPRDVEDDEGNTVHVYAQSETTYGEPAGLFGINCGHYPIPFIPGFSRIREPRQTAEENAEAYQNTQKQRYLERKLRDEKRDLEVLKAQGASEEELKIQRQKIRKASENIDNFCEETGLPRRRNRETAPVRATWPTETGPVEKFGDWYIATDSKLTERAISNIPNVEETGAMRGVPRMKPLSPKEAAEGANPLYDKGVAYRTNCANCVVAEELRIRGYDVTAKQKNSTTNISRFWYDGKEGRGSWTDSFKGGLEYKNIDAKRKAQQVPKIQEIMDGWGKESRAVVFVKWDGSNTGHYFTAANTENGVEFINPQRTKLNAENFFTQCKPSKTALFRVDDKDIAEFAREVVEWTEEKLPE